MQVKDIMTKDVISVEPETNVEEIAGILSKNRIHAVPVVDKSKKVLGIISERDFFIKDSEFYLPLLMNVLKRGRDHHFGLRSAFKKIFGNSHSDNVKMVVNARAKDIMTSGCITVNPEMDIKELVNLFKKTNLVTFPVTEGEGILAGIITLNDVVQLF